MQPARARVGASGAARARPTAGDAPSSTGHARHGAPKRRCVRPSTADASSCPVQVLGPGDATTEVDSSALVPGDLVLVRRGRLPADMLLLSGEAVVDEAKLTGESVAVRKVPYCASSCRHLGASTAAAGAGGEFDGSEEAAQAGLGVAEDQPQAVLSGDTEVQVALAAPGAAAGAPVAVVLNSGFASAKGGMLRGMMHPTKHK